MNSAITVKLIMYNFFLKSKANFRYILSLFSSYKSIPNVSLKNIST